MKSDLGQRVEGRSVRERVDQLAPDRATQKVKGAVSDSFARFVISDNGLGEALRFAAGTALRAIPSADAAVVSLTGKRSAEVEVSTRERMDISGLHRADQPGPCQKAMEDGSSQVVASMLSESRWPEFTNAALYSGVQSVVACRLSLTDGGQGLLCLYSSREDAFGGQDVAVAEFLAHRTSVLLSNVRAYESAAELARQLDEALQSRAVIDQAKGIVMARDNVSAEEAFETLKKLSQRSNIKVRELAQRLVASVAERSEAAR